MANALDRIKTAVLTDQQNLFNGRVTAIGSSTATVRLSTGKTVTAGNSYGASSGDQVEVKKTGSTYTITGSANLSDTAALKTQTV